MNTWTVEWKLPSLSPIPLIFARVAQRNKVP